MGFPCLTIRNSADIHAPPSARRSWRNGTARTKTGSGTVSSMSLGGCYVLTNKPAQFAERVFIAMVHEIPEIECQVRYVDPEVGMGVEFIGMKLEVRQMLDEFLQARAAAWK